MIKRLKKVLGGLKRRLLYFGGQLEQKLRQFISIFRRKFFIFLFHFFVIIFPFLKVSSAFDSLDGCLTDWERLPHSSERLVASTNWRSAADRGRVTAIVVWEYVCRILEYTTATAPFNLHHGNIGIIAIPAVWIARNCFQFQTIDIIIPSGDSNLGP